MKNPATLGLLFLLCAASAAAQSIHLSLNIAPRPNPYLSAWETKRETAILTVTNLTGKPVTARLNARVLVDGTLMAETKPTKMRMLTINPGVSNYFADEIVPDYAIIFYGDVERSAKRTGMLPAGTYEMCVEMFDDNAELLSAPACRVFFVTSYQLPTLLNPADQSSIPLASRPVFRWSPVVPAPLEGARYRLLLFEVYEGQFPMQAFRANMPVMDVEIALRTQLIWPAEYPLPDKPGQYVWTVQTLDGGGRPVGEKDGFTDPAVFDVGVTGDVKR